MLDEKWAYFRTLQGHILYEQMKNFFLCLLSLSALQIHENHMHLTESMELYWY